MNKHEFRQLFNEKILILDGATGTNLMNAGMPLGVCPEKYIIEHKKVMLELQTSYLNQAQISYMLRHLPVIV